MKYKVTAIAPTTYQLQSVRHFGSPVKSHGNGSHSFSQVFDSEEEAKAYLVTRAELYYTDSEEELKENLEQIEKYGSLILDAVSGSIEEIEEEIEEA